MPDRTVMTVLGPIPADELGVTLAHEHLQSNFEMYFMTAPEASRQRDVDRPIDMSMLSDLRRWPFSTTRDNLVFNDVDASIAELEYFIRAGGRSVVDQTCINVGRDPAALQRISRATGLHIVTATGFYVESAQPDWVAGATADDLAQVMITEIQDGIGDTGVRPGVIGEIGVSGRLRGAGLAKVGPITDEEVKGLRAAGRASLQTGLAVSVHTDPLPPHGALRVIDILEEEGVSPDRIIIDHLDNTEDLDLHRAVADRGVFVEYDHIGRDSFAHEWGYGHSWGHDSWRARFAKTLIDEGHGSQLLFSQDCCTKIDLRGYGGPGFAHVLENFVPTLRAMGVSSDDLDDILVTNPARAFSVEG